MDATAFFFFSYTMQVLIYDNLIKLCQNIRPKKKSVLDQHIPDTAERTRYERSCFGGNLGNFHLKPTIRLQQQGLAIWHSRVFPQWMVSQWAGKNPAQR